MLYCRIIKCYLKNNLESTTHIKLETTNLVTITLNVYVIVDK